MMNANTTTQKELTGYPSMLLNLKINLSAMRIVFAAISSLFLALAIILPSVSRYCIKR